MEDRTRRIIETAIELAERDGFEAVRLRDVARLAKVALGTVYRRFRSKEDILVAALEHEVNLFINQPIEGFEGNTPEERATHAFAMMTHWFCNKPHFARACLRAAASGVPEISEKVTRFHDLMTNGLVLVMTAGETTNHATEQHYHFLAHTLQNIWFAELVGWAGGLHEEREVIQRMAKVSQFLLNAPMMSRAESVA